MKEMSPPSSSKGFSINTEKGPLGFKIIFLWALSAVAAFSVSWFFSLGIKSSQAKFFFFSGIAALIFLIIFVLESLFIDNNGKAASVMLFQSLAFGLLFIAKPISALILIGVLFWILFYGSWRGQKILNNAIKFSFFDFCRVVLPKGILAISLVFSFIVAFSLKIAPSQEFPLPNVVFEKIIESSQVIVKQVFPGMDVAQPIGVFTKQMAEGSIDKMPEANVLPSAMRQQLVKKTAQSFQDQISEVLGIKIDPDKKLSEVLYQIARDKFSVLSEEARNWFFIIIGGLVFLTIEGVSIPIRWIISFIAFIIYKMLLAAGIIRISIENSAREVIVID